jgi:hypothetical protein
MASPAQPRRFDLSRARRALRGAGHRALLWFGGSMVSEALAYLLPLLAGILLSVQDFIALRYWRPWFLTDGPISLLATAAWGSVVAGVAVILARKRLQNIKDAERDTLPPASFLVGYATTWETLHTEVIGPTPVIFNAQPAVASTVAEQEVIRLRVREMLAGIVAIIAAFEHGQDIVPSYSANVMVYRDTAGLSRDLQAEIQARSPFLGSRSIAQCRGVLDLCPSLSMRGIRPDRDPNISRLALPIPLKPSEIYGVDDPVLPGAPSIYCFPPLVALFEGGEMGRQYRRASWSKDKDDVAKALDSYFAGLALRDIRSFATFKLDASLSGTAPIGVLNVNSSQHGMLKTTARWQSLVFLLRPALLSLLDLITMLPGDAKFL